MILKHFAAYIKMMILVVFIGVLLIPVFPPYAVSSEDTNKTSQDGIQLIGIINPDGATALWPVLDSLDGHMDVLLAPYPIEIKEGFKFYSLTSWKDMAVVMTAINKHQMRVIQQLATDLKTIAKRVNRLEKRRRATVYAGSVNHRLKKLEKQVKAAFDGGNP